MRSTWIVAILVCACGATNHDDWVQQSTMRDTRSKQVIASNPPLTGETSIDKWTKLFYAKALQVGKRVNRDVTIAYANDSYFIDFQVGICISWTDGRNDVELKQSWWIDSDLCMQGMLVIHELGHCAINRGHESTGIMQPMLGACKTEQETIDALGTLMMSYIPR